MLIRKLQDTEHGEWLHLRELLWPDTTRQELTEEQKIILADSARNCVLVAALPDGQLAGFVEVSLRDWADGCETRPVGYIEGWYVEPDHRRSGVGRRLIQAAEEWALSLGCTEMGSDVELPNEISHKAHRSLGYSEVVRLVLYKRKLVP